MLLLHDHERKWIWNTFMRVAAVFSACVRIPSSSSTSTSLHAWASFAPDLLIGAIFFPNFTAIHQAQSWQQFANSNLLSRTVAFCPPPSLTAWYSFLKCRNDSAIRSHQANAFLDFNTASSIATAIVNILNLTNATRCTTVSHILKQLDSNRFRFVLLVPRPAVLPHAGSQFLVAGTCGKWKNKKLSYC